MKIALAVPRLMDDVNANIETIHNLLFEARHNGAALILFPEAVLTGLINNDIYERDIKLAVSLNHPIILDFCIAAKKNNVWLCFGFLENDRGCIYDSAVLINANGEINIHYRRINPQWRGKNLPAAHYSEGTEMMSSVTPFGKISILVCGDLFDDRVIEMLDPIRPDLILFPFARCFSSKITDIHREWEETEKYEYIEQVKRTGATVAMSNYIGSANIDDTSFGGAFIINARGDMLASLPLMQEGLLYYETGNLHNSTV